MEIPTLRFTVDKNNIDLDKIKEFCQGKYYRHITYFLSGNSTNSHYCLKMVEETQKIYDHEEKTPTNIVYNEDVMFIAYPNDLQENDEYGQEIYDTCYIKYSEFATFKSVFTKFLIEEVDFFVERSSYIYEDIEIVIDDIKDLGTFVQINSHNIKQHSNGQKKLPKDFVDLITSCGICTEKDITDAIEEENVYKSYRDLILEKIKFAK